jgi:hypothetical protein
MPLYSLITHFTIFPHPAAAATTTTTTTTTTTAAAAPNCHPKLLPPLLCDI